MPLTLLSETFYVRPTCNERFSFVKANNKEVQGRKSCRRKGAATRTGRIEKKWDNPERGGQHERFQANSRDWLN